MEPKTTETNEVAEQVQVVAAFQDRLDRIPEGEVKSPGMLPARFLAAALVLMKLATEQVESLAAVGMPRLTLGTVEARLHGLRAAEGLLRAERLEGWSLTTEKLRRTADLLRAEMYAAAVLALRRHPDGHRWALEIRGGTQLLSLHADLVCLAQLLWDNRMWFESIRLDVDVATKRLAQTGHALCDAMAAEQVARGLTGSKRARDRMYTLCCDTLEEVVAFAVYATRGRPAAAAEWELACRGAEVPWAEPVKEAGARPGGGRRAA